MGNKGLVLVVDDEREELDHHAAILRDHGFEAVVAATLDDAERLYAEHREDLDGVILDGCVPDTRHTTKPLIRKMRVDKEAGFFRGRIVAASGDRFLRIEMRVAGCDIESPKREAAEQLIKLLTT